jgi:addiction module RelB/DinJ family antitoxin
MSDLTSLNIKIERTLKTEADAMFKEMGMTLTTAINVFVRQAVKERAIPFKIHVDDKKQRFHYLLNNIRMKNEQVGFLTDEEIEAEILAARAEMKAQGEDI